MYCCLQRNRQLQRIRLSIDFARGNLNPEGNDKIFK